MKYKIGQLYMWRSTEGIFGKAINLGNKMRFPKETWLPTHIGIISHVDDNLGLVSIHEATNKGFVCTDYPIEWLNEKIEQGYCKIGEVKEELNEVYETCEKYKGIRYGWLDIVAISLSYIFGYKVIGLSGKNAIICSEAVSRILYDSSNKKINFQEEYGIVYDAVTPAHIYLSKFVKIL